MAWPHTPCPQGIFLLLLHPTGNLQLCSLVRVGSREGSQNDLEEQSTPTAQGLNNNSYLFLECSRIRVGDSVYPSCSDETAITTFLLVSLGKRKPAGSHREHEMLYPGRDTYHFTHNSRVETVPFLAMNELDCGSLP